MLFRSKIATDLNIIEKTKNSVLLKGNNRNAINLFFQTNNTFENYSDNGLEITTNLNQKKYYWFEKINL